MGAVGAVALPVIGGAGGFMLGGAGGAALGMNIGSGVASLFRRGRNVTNNLPDIHGDRLNNLKVQLSSYGAVIPKLYGTMRLAGNVIWQTDIVEHEHIHTHSVTQMEGGKGGSGRRNAVTNVQKEYSYSYSITLAISICEGEVEEITRI